jgi:hypothetical protein
MEWVETTGDTLEEAKNLALDQLGVAEDDAEFEIVAASAVTGTVTATAATGTATASPATNPAPVTRHPARPARRLMLTPQRSVPPPLTS